MDPKMMEYENEAPEKPAVTVESITEIIRTTPSPSQAAQKVYDLINGSEPETETMEDEE